jgi:hypothetical protein
MISNKPFSRLAVATAIRQERGVILCGCAPGHLTDTARGELRAGVDIAKALARTLGSTDEQREFLAACGIPDETL